MPKNLKGYEKKARNNIADTNIKLILSEKELKGLSPKRMKILPKV